MDIRIEASVGRGGENRAADTRKIQRLLNEIFPAARLEVDGDCGKKTIRRIVRFQKGFMTEPDGRVDPGGRTLKRMQQAAPGTGPDWSGDSATWSREKKLASLDRRMRPKVDRVLAALEAEGFKPKIFYAWRSVAVQQEIFERGHSKVRFSFHNAQKKDGTPNAYAADIIDRRWAWDAKAKSNGFWDALGRAARAEGLFWDGSWTKFKDWAHVQLHPNSELAAVKRESGLA